MAPIIKQAKKYQNLIWLAILIVLSSLHLLYAIRTSLYFSVDDFFVLSYIRNHSVTGIFANFLLQGDLFGFRKVLGYEVMKVLFDFYRVNPIPYILTNHYLQLANLILLFFIIKLLTKDSVAAFFCGILFNKVYLFYFSNIHEYLACFFALLTIFLFLKYPKKIFLYATTFVLALLAKELAFSIPFILLSLTFVKKIERKVVIPLFGILLIYAIYQLSFFVKGSTLPQNISYQVSFSLSQTMSSLTYYFSIPVILLFAVLIIFQKKFSSLWLAASVLLTILPTLFLHNRHEAYYIYIPFAYLMILLSTLLPKLSLKNLILYAAIIFIFGGRSVFPIIARQDYPNWQKKSMESVISKVTTTLTGNAGATEISLQEVNIERDARLMLQTGTLDLFLPSGISAKYSFTYSESQKLIEVRPKT